MKPLEKVKTVIQLIPFLESLRNICINFKYRTKGGRNRDESQPSEVLADRGIKVIKPMMPLEQFPKIMTIAEFSTHP
jgi:hypothetical protein